ncbi:MAG TPA: hypothetical protein VG994_18020 [Steroidobacteraceae bacterium]|nr:hypothetical protein [Steroidobacteraceae bacterium]
MKLLLAALFAARAAAALADAVTFDWFEYTGHDTVFETPLPARAYRNPILAGFYPDPSVTRVGLEVFLAVMNAEPTAPDSASSTIVSASVGNVNAISGTPSKTRVASFTVIPPP